MTAEADPERFRVDVSAARWACPRGWTATAEPPPGPRILWGQDALVAGLQLTAAAAGGARPRHAEVTAPARVEVIAGIVDALRAAVAEGVAVRWITRASEEDLRGRDGRSGALAEADGGVVVLDALDLLEAPERWRAVREAMAFATVRRMAGKGSDEPDSGAPIPETDAARVAVVVVGSDAAVRKLREGDERAAQLLRFRLEWTPDLPRTFESGQLLVTALRQASAEFGIDGVSPGGYGFLLEDLAAAGRRNRLAVDLRRAEDALLEAAAARSGSAPLDRRAMRSAAAAVRARQAEREDSHRRRAALGQLKLETHGEALGVVNGLMVYGQARKSYAMPGRITAAIAVGREGLINVEREAKYSGRSFDKGVYQLAGLLRSLFAAGSPLGVAATLTFEQSYGRVDGDSATLAEAIAVLSCAAQLPARQDLAVSGSINPRGEVLPVGSISLKVEGWYRTCLDQGLTGTQGVVLPLANVPDLQISETIVAAIADGTFSLWAVDSVDDAVEIVLGRKAGRRPGKPYLGGSVYGRAGQTMRRMSERLYPPRKQVAKKPEGKKADGKKTQATPPVKGPSPSKK